MPRNQEFNTQDALDKSLQVFWNKGFKGASLQDLLSEMGIGKGSFYATFGSKRELFLSVLKRYGKKQAMVCEVADIMEEKPVKDAIAEVYSQVIDRAVNEKRCCLFGKTALEFWQSDPEISQEVSHGVGQVESAFYNLICRGQAQGEVAVDADPKEIASFLTSVFYGLQMMAGSNPNRDVLNRAVTMSLKVLS